MSRQQRKHSRSNQGDPIAQATQATQDTLGIQDIHQDTTDTADTAPMEGTTVVIMDMVVLGTLLLELLVEP
jgi:hypothetical protein